MKNWLQILTIILLVMLTQVAVTAHAVAVENGVSWTLAQYRSAHISNVCYNLSFTVPSQKSEPVYFEETLTFDWTGGEDLQIDFQGDASQLSREVLVNDTRVNTVLINEHIVILAQYLVQGSNSVSLSGYSGDKALNRSDDYLYTLFVPDHARSVFACFEQPDLKARFSLNLTVPDGWVSISNETTKPIPTYLFSFTTGRFQVKTAMRDGRQLTALYRETDPAKVAQLPIVFDQVALSLQWMEEYTGIPYPFEHYGFVVLPGYQFGGMEHPGCIQFNDQRIFAVSPVQLDRDALLPKIHDEIRIPSDSVLRDLLMAHSNNTLLRILDKLHPKPGVSKSDIVLAVPVDAGDPVVRVFAARVPLKDQL